MIYTVTFNPSLDYIVSVSDFKLGLTNRTDSELLLPGGKGINVSTVLKNLGVDSVALGFVAGFTGKAIEEGVAALGVKADFITVSDGVSRINVKLKAGEETEINGKGPNISDAELEELYKKLDEKARNDLEENNVFWDRFEGKTAEVSTKVNDTYLKAHSQTDGVLSYGRMVDLMLADFYSDVTAD